MADLSPTPADKLRRLIPRLASDSDGEVLATVAAIRRTLARAGIDLHDLAARLTDPARPCPEPPRRQPSRDPESAEALAEAASWLRREAWGRLTEKQRDFVVSAHGLLKAGQSLSPRQRAWLLGLLETHQGK